MKRLALLVAATAAIMLFTACPDKPTEPVVIPDGTYEETAHVFRYRTVRDSAVLIDDTIKTAIVDIKDGHFMYRGMCKDTFTIKTNTYPGYEVRYHSPFIYADEFYCDECNPIRYPARVMKDGFFLVNWPHFKFGFLIDGPRRDTSYNRNFRIYKDGENYTFEQYHDNKYMTYYGYRIQHTLIPLSNQ